MRYYVYATIGLIGSMFGAGYVEDPNNNIYVGMVMLYSFVGFLCYSIVQIVRKDHKQI
tara:strand:+ start:564 stop:737 length:174 start_codon:yes stop_codon:yes gene_type:complete